MLNSSKKVWHPPHLAPKVSCSLVSCVSIYTISIGYYLSWKAKLTECGALLCLVVFLATFSHLCKFMEIDAKLV